MSPPVSNIGIGSGAVALGISAVETITGSSLSTLFLKPYRALGTIIPDCAVEEQWHDVVAITEHPVERGANIADHAYLRPVEVMLRYGWSDSLGGYLNYVLDVYNALLALKSARTPFTIYTGKRVWPNMLIQELFNVTDSTSENILEVRALCREVILVDTVTTSVASADNQAAPQETAQVQPTGNKQLQAVNDPSLTSRLPNFQAPGATPAGGLT